MNCVRCGREIPKGEIFCESCANAPLSEERQANRPTSAGRHLAKKKKKEKSKASWGIITALVLVSLLCVALAGLSVYMYQSVWQQRAAMRAHEAELAQREQVLIQTEAQLQEQQAELEDAGRTIAQLNTQIITLKEQIRGSQSQSSQSQYDLTAAQQMIEQLQEKQAEYEETLAALTEQMTNLQADYDILLGDFDTLKGEYEALEDQNETMGDKLAWIDAYVVYVENDGSGHYHTFECENFKRQSFWVYNRKLAENKGYSPCPICGG